MRGARRKCDPLENYTPEPNSGCWLFLGYVVPFGHGRAFNRVTGRVEWAHRMAWEHFVGVIPEGVWVLHKCDVPCCINPDHLWLGTHADNQNDKLRKGRQGRMPGEVNGRAIITAGDVIAIRADTRSQTIIAEDYGIKQPQVSRIKLRTAWKHLP